MKKLIFLICFVILMTSVTSCSSQHKQEKDEQISILKIDGVEVPLLNDENAVAKSLGNNYSRLIDFEFSQDVDTSEAVLVLTHIDSTNDYADIYTYQLNTQEDNLEKHNIELLNYDITTNTIDEILKNYSNYIITDSYGDYQLEFANGRFIEFKDGKRYSEEGIEIAKQQAEKLINGEIKSSLNICIFKSDDDYVDEIIFTVTEKKQN